MQDDVVLCVTFPAETSSLLRLSLELENLRTKVDSTKNQIALMLQQSTLSQLMFHICGVSKMLVNGTIKQTKQKIQINSLYWPSE
jgi:hypothetical protein